MKTINYKNKFSLYFRLNDDMYIFDDDIRGEFKHEGLKCSFHLYLTDETVIYNIKADEEFEKLYSRDLEGANAYLEDCWRSGIGFELEVDYPDNINWNWHPFDFVLAEEIYQYFHPSIVCPSLETVE